MYNRYFYFLLFCKRLLCFRPRGGEMIVNSEIGFTKLSDRKSRVAIMVGPVPKSSAVKINLDPI